MLRASPDATGSVVMMVTVGMVCVALAAAKALACPPATITSGLTDDQAMPHRRAGHHHDAHIGKLIAFPFLRAPTMSDGGWS
jgi:hypothetical protein